MTKPAGARMETNHRARSRAGAHLRVVAGRWTGTRECNDAMMGSKQIGTRLSEARSGRCLRGARCSRGA